MDFYKRILICLWLAMFALVSTSAIAQKMRLHFIDVGQG
jgi:hypothetical protein